MGCGASSQLDVKEGRASVERGAVKNTSVAENLRQRSNLRHRHGNLLNVIDESIDVTKAFKELAIQSRQPGLFWTAWLADAVEVPADESGEVSNWLRPIGTACT